MSWREKRQPLLRHNDKQQQYHNKQQTQLSQNVTCEYYQTHSSMSLMLVTRVHAYNCTRTTTCCRVPRKNDYFHTQIQRLNTTATNCRLAIRKKTITETVILVANYNRCCRRALLTKCHFWLLKSFVQHTTQYYNAVYLQSTRTRTALPPSVCT